MTLLAEVGEFNWMIFAVWFSGFVVGLMVALVGKDALAKAIGRKEKGP